MDNKKIDLLFGLVVIAFLFVTLLLIKDFKNKRVSDYDNYSSVLVAKNYKIRLLANQLVMEMKANRDLTDTLADTRNQLDVLSKKLAESGPQVPAVPPVIAPEVATAQAAPATAAAAK